MGPKKPVLGSDGYADWVSRNAKAQGVIVTHLQDKVMVEARVPAQRRLKWDPKSQSGVFVGYGEDTKDYRVYFPETGVVGIRRDVIFDPDKRQIDQLMIPLDHTNEEVQEEGNGTSQDEDDQSDGQSGSSIFEECIEEISDTSGTSDSGESLEDSNATIIREPGKRRIVKPNRYTDQETSFLVS